MDTKLKQNKKNQSVSEGKPGKKLWIGAFLVFELTFLIIHGCTLIVNQSQRKNEELKAVYTAESTISKVEAQLNRYLAESDLIKKTIEDGNFLSDGEFSKLSQYMQDDDHVIKAHEIAKDGIVTQIYPMSGNEDAIGLNMLENPERKYEARLAKESGEYTIAGPYELVQGGIGSLLFDPIYTEDASGHRSFWGFSILVIDWEKFIDKMELDKLEAAGYDYRIWKKKSGTENKIIISQCGNLADCRSMQVACSVPNDTWYFDIIPQNGWITATQRISALLISVLMAVIMTLIYIQVRMRRYREALYEKKLEKSAQEARSANEAKTRFLFNMSHDIRTPMNAIIGFSELLEKHIDEKEKVKDYIGKIRSSSEFLLSLINYVLEMARIESGKTALKNEVRSVSALMKSLSAVFEPEVQKKQIQYTCTTDIKHEYVLGDETKVREIINNIIGNSLKYTQNGGKVSVDVTEIPSEKENHTAFRIIVKDNGIGMSEEYLPHIFEEFSRERSSTESKVTGTGLGLPIVKSLVELMGGTIDVKSRPGEGTETTVVLPFEIASEEQISKIQNKDNDYDPVDFKGRRILLAEDNELNAEIATTMLKESGLEVERVENGKECVDLLRKMPEDYYDLILMDIQMPEMDGYEATQTIRKLDDKRASIPIVAMTANAFAEDQQKSIDMGMNAHIAKPVDVNTLLTVMAKIIKQ